MPQLTRHADFPAPAIAIEAQARREGGRLWLRYVLTGATGTLALAPVRACVRAHELWRHTCFEAFVQPEDAGSYVELNLAPSTEWAAYAFDGYRAGMRDVEIARPAIQVRRGDDRLELEAEIDLSAALPASAWRVGLTAVIEDTAGARSYWALQHPPGKPDFHNADCFVLELPGSRGA